MNYYSQFWLDYCSGAITNLDKEFEIRDFLHYLEDNGHIGLILEYIDMRYKEIQNGTRDRIEAFTSAV